MRTKRARLLTVGAATAALAWALLPSAASAAPATSSRLPGDTFPKGSAPVSATGTQARLVADPPSSAPCTSTKGAEACFEISGDRFWVDDTLSDGASALAEWLVYSPDGTFQRADECINSSGLSGGWKDCNYNFEEGNTVQWRACAVDRSSSPQDVLACSNWREDVA